jgi:stalled ribosome rescue protein Dom34
MNEEKKTMIIACYRQPYSKKSMNAIKEMVKNIHPSKVIILSITEFRKSSGTIESYLSRKDQEQLKKQVEKDRNIRASGYSDKILKMINELGVPAKKIRKSGDISTIILQSIKKYNPSHVIIHPSSKSRIDKMLVGSVEDNVCRESMSNITILKY